MSLNQQYNKTITFHPMKISPDKPFNLCTLTYNGQLTRIVDVFNKLQIENCIKIVQDSKDPETNRNALQIASFLNFSNIFLYLLSYNADPYYCDNRSQSTWHMITYKGNTRLLSILLNHERYKLKMKSLAILDNIKKSFGFSNLDIVKGKLSRAVHLSESNLTKFNNLQTKLKEEGKRLITEFIDKLSNALLKKDKNGQNPIHLGAMSKFSLSHLTCYILCDFDFFKLDETWADYLSVHQDLQSLEIKEERTKDPRRCLRLEREFTTLLGDNIIKDYFSPIFNQMKKELLHKVINATDTNGDSVLHIASFHGDFRIVNKLSLFGGNKKLQNDTGKLPVDMAKDNFVRKVLTNLNKAAKSSDEKNIRELVNFGNDINEQLSIFSQAPIHKIVESQSETKYAVLQKMIDMGADLNIKDSNGWSALHFACQLGDIQSVQILVTSKSEIDSYSNNKRIPLHLAANMNFPDIVKYLLDNKSDPNYKDQLGCTPMHLAAKQGNTECIVHLLENNGDLYAEDFRGWNILHYAAFHGHQKTVRFISKYDSDYDVLRNKRNSQNKIPIEIVRDPKVKPYFTSLWHAAKEGNLDITRNLLNDGENVDELSHFERNSALHLAVMNNHYLLVRLLIESKCNTTLRNKDDIEPAQFASLMNGPIRLRYQAAEDRNRETMDLRDVIRQMVNKSNEVIDATICKENWKVKVWKANDFSNKIRKMFGSEEENNNKVPEEEQKIIEEDQKNEAKQ